MRNLFFFLVLFSERGGAHFDPSETGRSRRICLKFSLWAILIGRKENGGETKAGRTESKFLTSTKANNDDGDAPPRPFFSLFPSPHPYLNKRKPKNPNPLPKTKQNETKKQNKNSLYVETVDLGEPEPRTIVSGLVKYVPIDQMRDRLVVALCNLKPRNMRGVKSDGMLLCASDAAHENVEPLDPPAGAAPGERIGFELDGARPGEQPAPAGANQVQKKKVWEAVQPELRVLDSRVASWKGSEMVTTAGTVTAASLAGGGIS